MGLLGFVSGFYDFLGFQGFGGVQGFSDFVKQAAAWVWALMMRSFWISMTCVVFYFKGVRTLDHSSYNPRTPQPSAVDSLSLEGKTVRPNLTFLSQFPFSLQDIRTMY